MLRPGDPPVRIWFALVLSCAVALSQSPASAAPSDSAQVRATFAELAKAIGARDPDAGTRLLSAESLVEWQRDRDLALHGSRDTVAAQSPGRRLVVFALRHHAPKFLARDGSPSELAGYAIEAGLADRKSIAAIELGDVVVKGDRASGQLFASGLPSGFRAAFAREDGVWKLDLPATIDAAGRVVTRAATASDASEDSIIAGLLLVSSGARPTAQIWTPLAKREPVRAVH
jgi:hypothetical protein